MGIITQALLSFLGTLLLYGIYKLLRIVRRQWTSPLRALPGPKSHNFVLGNVVDILKNNGSIMHDKWFDE